MSTSDVMEHFERASREFDRRVRGIGADQWHDPTPCTEWDVHALVNHIVYEMRWTPPLVSGLTIADVGERLDGDLLGSDPQRAWDEASAEAGAALRQSGALDRIVHLSFGDHRAEEYAWQLTADLALHAWDLARGTGGDELLDSELVDAVLARMEPRRDELAASGVFGAPVEVPDDADAQTRLLGIVGRSA